jgi:hypothetical protein
VEEAVQPYAAFFTEMAQATIASQTFFQLDEDETEARSLLVSSASYSLSEIASRWARSLASVEAGREELEVQLRTLTAHFQTLHALTDLDGEAPIAAVLGLSTPEEPSDAGYLIAYRQIRSGLLHTVEGEDNPLLVHTPAIEPCPFEGCTSLFTLPELLSWLQQTWATSPADMSEVYRDILPEAWASALAQSSSRPFLHVTSSVPTPPTAPSPWDDVTQFAPWPGLEADSARSGPPRSDPPSQYSASFAAPWPETVQEIRDTIREMESQPVRIPISDPDPDPDPNGWTQPNCK